MLQLVGNDAASWKTDLKSFIHAPFYSPIHSSTHPYLTVKMASMAEMMQQPGMAGGNFFKDVFWGPNGWEELKKVIKGGSK